MNTLDIQKKLLELPIKYAKLERDLATKEAVFKNLDEQKKVMLAKAKQHVVKEGGIIKPSEVYLERLALVTKLYGDHVEALNIAREDYLKARAELNAINVEYECLRSANSHETAKMKII